VIRLFAVRVQPCPRNWTSSIITIADDWTKSRGWRLCPDKVVRKVRATLARSCVHPEAGSSFREEQSGRSAAWLGDNVEILVHIEGEEVGKRWRTRQARLTID
jgi:hypothetical protein